MAERFFGLREFGQGLAGMAAGGATTTAVAVSRAALRLPAAYLATHRRIRKENRVGPNVKNVATATLPVIALGVLPLSAVSSLLYGMGAGTFKGVDHPPAEVAKSLGQQVAKIDEDLVRSLLESLNGYEPEPLPDGTVPFDISPLRALKALGIGLSTTVVEGPLLTGVYLKHAPKIWWKGSKYLFTEVDLNLILMSVLGELLLTNAVVLLAPLTLIGSALYSLGAGCKRGYQRGLEPAFTELQKDVKIVDDFLTQTVGEFIKRK